MTSDTGRWGRFPLVVLVAFGAGHFAVVLVQGVVRHGVMIKEQMLVFPPFRIMAFRAIHPQGAPMGIVLLVADGAVIAGAGQLPKSANGGGGMAVLAVGGQMFAGEIDTAVALLQDMLDAGVLLRPPLHVVTGDAGGPIALGMFHLVADLTPGGQALEFGGSQRRIRRRGQMTLDAGGGRMFSEQGELALPIMVELQGGPFPGRRRGVALGAGLVKLPGVRVRVAITALHLQAAELG